MRILMFTTVTLANMYPELAGTTSQRTIVLAIVMLVNVISDLSVTTNLPSPPLSFVNFTPLSTHPIQNSGGFRDSTRLGIFR